MDKREKSLWVKALRGYGRAYRKLGVLYLRERADRKDVELGRLCLERSMELGDEGGYLIYHHLFSRGRKVIDDKSYEDIWKEYQTAREEREKRRLKWYLRLGTKGQKARLDDTGAAFPGKRKPV